MWLATWGGHGLGRISPNHFHELINFAIALSGNFRADMSETRTIAAIELPIQNRIEARFPFGK
jgi:hypothetical protein